jgi:hypothetical protein
LIGSLVAGDENRVLGFKWDVVVEVSDGGVVVIG